MTEYQTNDMWLAAFLMCGGAQIDRLLGGKNKRKTFVLKGEAYKIAEATREYYQGAARVDPKQLRHHLTDLKGFMSSRAVPTSNRKEEHDGASSRKDGGVEERKEGTSPSAEG